jgi:hypothetical protein
MFRTVWNGAVVAGNDQGGRLEGEYLPSPERLTLDYFTGNQTSVCWWKGCARYYRARASEGSAAAAPRRLPARAGHRRHVSYTAGVCQPGLCWGSPADTRAAAR